MSENPKFNPVKPPRIGAVNPDGYHRPPPHINNQIAEQRQRVQQRQNQKQTQENHRKKNKGGLPNPEVFSEDFAKNVGSIARAVSSISTYSILLGLVVTAAFLDVILGAFGLENIFDNSIPFGAMEIKTVWIAGAVSIFTSGIQVYLMLMWSSKNRNRKMNRQEKAVMYGLMILDTAIDMTVPGYLMYGETALTISLAGKPPMYYVVVILVGIACAFSENVIVSLRTLRRA